MKIRLKSNLTKLFPMMIFIQVVFMAVGELLFTDRLDKLSSLSLLISAGSFFFPYLLFLKFLNVLTLPHSANDTEIDGNPIAVITILIFTMYIYHFLNGSISSTYGTTDNSFSVKGNFIYPIKAFLFLLILRGFQRSNYKNVLLGLISGLLFLVDGRRWLMLLSGTYLICYGKYRFFQTLKIAIFLVPVFIFIFLVLSTIWDATRNERAVQSDILQTVYSAFEHRWSMFYFNSEVIEFRLEQSPNFYGVLTAIELNNSLPGPLKLTSYLDTDPLIENVISIGASDFPTNIVSFIIFDFGIFPAFLFAPFVLLVPFLLLSIARSQLMKLYLYCYATIVLASLEFQIVSYFILIRDIVLLLAIERIYIVFAGIFQSQSRQQSNNGVTS